MSSNDDRPAVKIAIAGITGIPGRQILTALLKAREVGDNIHLTVLKRQSTATTPQINSDDYEVAYVDYNDPSTLRDTISRLKPDIIISALHAEPRPTLDEVLVKAIIDAQELLSTKQLPPLYISGYTLDVLHPAAIALATPDIIGPKVQFARLLQNEAQKGHIRYCTLVTAGFMDYILPRGYTGVDLKENKAKLFDNGEHECTSSTLDFVAACVVKIVQDVFLRGESSGQHELINQRVRVAEVKYTGKQLVASAEKITGSTFEIEYVSTDERLAQARELSARGDHGPAVAGFFSKLVWGGSGAACFEDGLSFGQGRIKRRDLDDIMVEAVEEVKSGTKFAGVGR